MAQRRKILVTAALPYINNVPHLGHMVGSHLPADIFARYCRLRGHDVLFVGGSDEHGTPSEVAAASLGVDTGTFCDRLYEEHRKVYQWFNISYDVFSRTSRPEHTETTQAFFQTIVQNGFIAKGSSTLYYCEKDGRFLPDRYVKGTCSVCGNPDSYGDQCEKCGSLLDASQLKEPHCTICGGTPELKESNHLFLRLDALAPELSAWLETKKNVFRPFVYSWARGLLREGLRQRCITRDLKHGVPVPMEGYENKVFYVWFDAPIGYISATKHASPSRWKEFWQSPDAEIYNFLGKDNIPFHTVFWPAMLLANKQFNMPTNVIGLQYLNYEGGKFSKSAKRGVFCESLIRQDIDPDVVRAYLVSLIPETDDSEFKWAEFQTRVNSELIGNYGNFINRTTSFVNSRLGGHVHEPRFLDDLDHRVLAMMRQKVDLIAENLERADLRKAWREVLNLATEGNRYFNDTAPWKSLDNDRDRAERTLYVCACLCRALAIVSAPFIPRAAERIWSQLNLSGKVDEPRNWATAADPAFKGEHTLGVPAVLFSKLKTEDIAHLREATSQPIDLASLFS
jgi:methionyl-tRNA synthetase